MADNQRQHQLTTKLATILLCIPTQTHVYSARIFMYHLSWYYTVHVFVNPKFKGVREKDE